MDRSKYELSRFERDALEKLLAGDHPALRTLRQQLDRCRVTERRFTGVGFSTRLAVSPTAPRAELPVSRAEITDVIVEADTLQDGAGLVLFIESGALQTLEGATYAEPWPESIGSYRLRYVDAEHRDLESLAGPRRRSFPSPQLDEFRASQPLSRLEREVLEKFLAVDDPPSAVLRRQLELCGVARRELTGVGFFTDLAVPATAPRALLGADEVRLSGVLAEMDGLEHGAGFVLYIDHGVLQMLEGYCYDEPWPEHTGAFSLSYFDGKPEPLP